jgi:DNA-binding response OmpR family regulator
MTTGKDGKERAIKHLKRPLGISFKNLEDLCNRKKYDFNPGSLYSYISNIRKILNDDPRIIITAVPNVGYILSINN